ncbi:hypothetical protein GJ744_011323 [Endocarpon pusillum]|uniref:Uncharacterized protein n=1 Tax=Endocarpon pusillum TaxID=364733 RepID=A0A8H7E8E3_9EURO|nr:hypothetical protein GJ744_011323 [Endocarpon pusillum]
MSDGNDERSGERTAGHSRLEFFLIRLVLDHHVEDRPAILRYNVATYTQDGCTGNGLLMVG